MRKILAVCALVAASVATNAASDSMDSSVETHLRGSQSTRILRIFPERGTKKTKEGVGTKKKKKKKKKGGGKQRAQNSDSNEYGGDDGGEKVKKEVADVEGQMRGAVGYDGSSESINGPWPSCVGQTGEWCREHILAFDGSLEGSIYILPDGSFVTMDYNTKRVRIYINRNGIVVRSPNRG